MSIRTASAGQFEITVGCAYPVWCAIKIKGVEITRISHRDLADLEYAVGQAKKLARENLPEKYKDEV